MEIINKNGVRFIVGRNAEENEYLTQKYRNSSARGKDRDTSVRDTEGKNIGDRDTFSKNISDVLWFHIDAFPGPHVIVVPDEINGICGNDIQEAANYAVTYAKKDNMLVCYCKIQDLKKDKKDKAGTFIVKNERKLKGYNIHKS